MTNFDSRDGRDGQGRDGEGRSRGFGGRGERYSRAGRGDERGRGGDRRGFGRGDRRSFNRDDRAGRDFNRDDRGGRRFDRGDRGGRDFNRDDRGGRGFNRDDRGGRGFNRDDRGGRGFNRDDRGGRGFNRDDRGGRRFDRDDRGFNRDDRGGRGFNRDDRGGRRFDRDERGGRGFNRDDRGGRRDFNSGRGQRSDRFGRGDGFKKGGFQRGERFDKSDRFERSDRRGGRDFGDSRRDERGPKRFDRDQRGFDRNDGRDYGRDGRSFDKEGGRPRRDYRDDRTGRERDRGRGGQWGNDARDEVAQTYERFDNEFADESRMVDGLPIPDGVHAKEIGEETYAALETLGERNQNLVGKLLVMAGQLLDLDPEQAYAYAQAAVKRAGRVDVVREAAALTAYATERYAEALREVRAVRRMRNDDSLRAVEADCERGLDRPEKALEIVAETDLSTLKLDEQVELVLVAAGARADLGEHDTALILVDDALHRIGPDGDEDLIRPLMSAKVDHLRSLERNEQADEVEAAIPAEPEDNDIIDVELFQDADIDNRRSDLKGSPRALAEAYDTLVLDLDGVCYKGGAPVPHAGEGVSAAVEAGMNHVFVTNNSSRTPAAIAEQLTGVGMPAEASRVMTSAMDLVAVMAEEEVEEGASVFVIGGEGLRQAMSEAGYRVVESADDEPDVVVQGFDRSVDWQMLSEGAIAISNGARFFATNLDASLPIERGNALGNGALVRAVRYCTGKKPVAAGKPLPGIYGRVIEMVGGERAVSVGDRLETDIAGALGAGVPSMHVLTGVHDAKAVILADRGLRPQLVHTDMRGLLEPHPYPRHHQDGTWTCGVGQVAKVIGDRLSLDGVILEEETTVTLDSYRALIAAAWDQASEGPKVICPIIHVVDNDDERGIVEAPQAPEPTEAEESAEAAEAADDVAATEAGEPTEAEPAEDEASTEIEELAEEGGAPMASEGDAESATVPEAEEPTEVEPTEEEAPTETDEPAEADEPTEVELAEEEAPAADESGSASETDAVAEAPAEPAVLEIDEDDIPDNINLDDIPQFLPGEEDLEALLEETKDLEDRE